MSAEKVDLDDMQEPLSAEQDVADEGFDDHTDPSALVDQAPVLLSVLLEDYYQAPAFRGSIAARDWQWYPSRLEAVVPQWLDLLARSGVSATFFVLGWHAARNPGLVRRIADAGHEVACGPYKQLHAASLTTEAFREDVRMSKDAVENAAGRAVTGFRCASLSLDGSSGNAIETLASLGFVYDSSFGPGAASHIPALMRAHHFETAAGTIWELPASGASSRRLSPSWGILRHKPLGRLHSAAARATRREHQPFVLDVRAWEIDAAQPRLRCSGSERSTHYSGLQGASRRLERLLGQFRFATCDRAVQALANAHQSATVSAGVAQGMDPDIIRQVEALWLQGFGRWGSGWLTLLGVSMRPSLMPGDRVLVQRAGERGLRPGDIGVFFNGQRIVVHRVMAALGSGAGRRYVESGDANSGWSVLPASAVVGRVTAVERGGVVTEPSSLLRRFFSPSLLWTARLAFHERPRLAR